MTTLDRERDALVRRTLVTPAARRLNLALVACTAAEVRISMPFDQGNRTEGDVVHGGVIATLIDIAGVAVAIAGARQVPQSGATSNITTNYLRAAIACRLEAHGVLLRGGSRQNVARVTVSNGDGTAIAEGHVTVILR